MRNKFERWLNYGLEARILFGVCKMISILDTYIMNVYWFPDDWLAKNSSGYSQLNLATLFLLASDDREFSCQFIRQRMDSAFPRPLSVFFTLLSSPIH